MEAVAKGEADAGVIIHESRFTFPDYGLKKLLDLGDWWENETGHPIPLGGIVAKRSLGEETIVTLERFLKSSVKYALAHPGEANAYIRAHSQEMSDEVCAAHIDLYVNSFSIDLGDEGKDAISVLISRAEAAGLVPISTEPVFFS
jgi:1,4-dihydroxy-6-naphthoate synthase